MKLPVEDVVIVPTPAAETKSGRDVTNDVNLDSEKKKRVKNKDLQILREGRIQSLTTLAENANCAPTGHIKKGLIQFVE